MDIPAGNPPATPIMKGIPAHSQLVKVARGVFQRCVETTLRTKDFGAQRIGFAAFFSVRRRFFTKIHIPEVETYP